MQVTALNARSSVNRELGHFLIPSDAKRQNGILNIDWDVIRSAGDEFCRAKHVFYILDNRL